MVDFIMFILLNVSDVWAESIPMYLHLANKKKTLKTTQDITTKQTNLARCTSACNGGQDGQIYKILRVRRELRNLILQLPPHERIPSPVMTSSFL